MIIFGFFPQISKTKAVAVAFSMAWLDAPVEDLALERLGAFRGELYGCFTARADALFELGDALLCADAPVKTLVGLSLVPGHRRGHGALHDAVNAGRIQVGRLRRAVAALPLPRSADGRLTLAADVSNWLRPGAATSPERLFCHVHGRGKGNAQMIPGWPYPVVAALERGRTWWTAVLDAVRVGPDDDETAVTAAQVRDVVTRLAEAGQRRDGDPDILVVFDAGYDVTRLAWLLKNLPAELPGRLRSGRVLYFPAPGRATGAPGRPSRHGPEFKLAGPGTWPDPPVTTVTETTRYGTAVAQSRDRLHPRLTSRAAWEGHDGELPVIEGTLSRRRPLDLGRHRRPRPAPPRPQPRSRPATALGAPRAAGPAHPGQGAAGVPEHPREDHLSRRRTETRQTRPRAAARVEEPPAGHTSRRRQAPQGEHGEQGNRLNPGFSTRAVAVSGHGISGHGVSGPGVGGGREAGGRSSPTPASSARCAGLWRARCRR